MPLIKDTSASIKDMRERQAFDELLRQGNLFRPQTNHNKAKGIKRTNSCYSNVLNKKDLGKIIKNAKDYVHSNAGLTGYASVPNKSS